MATNETDSSLQSYEQSHPTRSSQPTEGNPESSGNRYNGTGSDNVSQAVDLADKARDLTGRTLDFLSHASNETLGACVVALGATTWLVLGRLGLVLIGIVGGVVLHATWGDSDRGSHDAEVIALDARKRREKGLDIAERILDWRENRRGEDEKDEMDKIDSKPTDFSTFRPETGAALTTLTNTIVDNYVKYVGNRYVL